MTDKPPQESRDRNKSVLRLCANERSVSEARHTVGDLCRSGGLTSLADDAELLTSELVTNACRAATGTITVVLFPDDLCLVVTVSDDDATPLACPASLPHADALSGRGLHLVDKIASDWGAVHHDSHGKTVWFRLDGRPTGPMA
jgi:anti-sigma regulatory factor (Ser/Thr protein kinase)